MNLDGSGVTQLTSNSVTDFSPSWQPVPGPYARPRGASPMRVSLVPAYGACTAPNRTHGGPLSFPSCAPPAQAGTSLTIGIGDGRAGTEEYHPGPR